MMLFAPQWYLPSLEAKQEIIVTFSYGTIIRSSNTTHHCLAIRFIVISFTLLICLMKRPAAIVSATIPALINASLTCEVIVGPPAKWTIFALVFVEEVLIFSARDTSPATSDTITLHCLRETKRKVSKSATLLPFVFHLLQLHSMCQCAST